MRNIRKGQTVKGSQAKERQISLGENPGQILMRNPSNASVGVERHWHGIETVGSGVDANIDLYHRKKRNGKPKENGNGQKKRANGQKKKRR